MHAVNRRRWRFRFLVLAALLLTAVTGCAGSNSQWSSTRAAGTCNASSLEDEHRGVFTTGPVETGGPRVVEGWLFVRVTSPCKGGSWRVELAVGSPTGQLLEHEGPVALDSAFQPGQELIFRVRWDPNDHPDVMSPATLTISGLEMHLEVPDWNGGPAIWLGPEPPSSSRACCPSSSATSGT